MPLHNQVDVVHPKLRQSLAVDEDIAPLLLALWRLGIDTLASCQKDGTGSIWVQFATARDAERFLSLVASIRDENGPEAADGLYRRVSAGVGGWSYEVESWDDSLSWDESRRRIDCAGPPEIALAVSVRFPIGDYFRVLQLTRQGGGPAA